MQKVAADTTAPSPDTTREEVQLPAQKYAVYSGEMYRCIEIQIQVNQIRWNNT